MSASVSIFLIWVTSNLSPFFCFSFSSWMALSYNMKSAQNSSEDASNEEPTFLFRFLTFLAMGSNALPSAPGVGGTDPLAGGVCVPPPLIWISIEGLGVPSGAPSSFLRPLCFLPRFSWSPFRAGDGEAAAPGTCLRNRPGAGLRLMRPLGVAAGLGVPSSRLYAADGSSPRAPGGR